MNYRFTLRTGSRKEICPNCGKKEFKPYIDIKTEKEVGGKYGRCERVNNCGYSLYPKVDKNDTWEPPLKPYVPPKPLDYVSVDLVNATFVNFDKNPFFMFLVELFGNEKANELQKQYNIGTAMYGGTVFWQKDRCGNYRTGKVMYYHENGKRNKDKKSWFVHSKISTDFNFRQCFFGIDTTSENYPIALCESEKTAILMSVYYPQFNWVASGGSEMLNLQRLNELPRLDKVFSDGGQFEKWEQKTRHFAGRQMDITVEKAILLGLIPEGSDIYDLIQEEKL